MKKRKNTLLAVIISVLAVMIILASILHCIDRVKTQLNSQVENSLIEIAQQNKEALENELESTHELLLGLSHELQNRNIYNRTLTMEFLNSYTNIYNFKYMGFVTSSGIVYTTEGDTTVLSDMSLFETSMNGEWFVSEKITDLFGDSQEVHVFSIPVYNKESTKIPGVLFAVIEAQQFENLLMHGTFNGKGSCIVYSTAGNEITGAESFSHEIEDSKLASLIYRQQPEQIVYDGDNYVYYMRIDTMDDTSQWYLFTVVPASVLTEQFDPIWYDVQRLLVVTAAVLLLLLVIYVIYYHNQRKLLIELAYKDVLTQGDNYAYFKEKLRVAQISHGSIVAVDIADFRIINSICGEKMGDQVIQNIWKLLNSFILENEYAAHINADQFIIYFDSEDREVIKERLTVLKKKIYELTASMRVPHVEPYFGVCILDDYQKIEKVHNRAVQAKNSIKGRRNENVCFYEDKVFQQILDNKQLEDRFESAIEKEEFEVWYQPKYDTVNEGVVGAEALVRWNIEGNLVPPYKFIPLFEKNGMIAALDEYVFKHVCMQQKKWQAEGRNILPISVNISRASLFYREIAYKYEEILHSCEIDPKYVQLEITESAMLENDDIKTLMEDFHNTGFKLLLDDFGNGYSSLSTLNTMQFDILKIDKSLIDYIGDHNGEELLRHTIELAKYLGLHVTAEGVEMKEQIQFLQQVKCDDIQGFYFSKPLPEKVFEDLLNVK